MRSNLLKLALALTLPFSHALPSIQDRSSTTSQRPVAVTFEDPSLNVGTIIRDLNGLYFDGFVSLVEAPVGQLVLFDGKKAAVPAPSGNQIRTDLSTTKYKSLNLHRVSTACFLNKNLGAILGDLPLSSLGLDELSTALKNLAGAASTAVECSVRVRVLGMVNAGSLAILQRKGKDFKDCHFKPTINVLGQGEGEVQHCDLNDLGWNGVTRLNFTIESVGSVTLPGSSTGAAVPVIDDLAAIGNLK